MNTLVAVAPHPPPQPPPQEETSMIISCCQGDSPCRELVFPNKLVFFKQGTVKFDQLLLLALGSDNFTVFQELVIQDTLLIP